MTEINDIQAFCDENEEAEMTSPPETDLPEEPAEESVPEEASPPEQQDEADKDPVAALSEQLATQHQEQLSYISALSSEVEELSSQVAAGNRAIAVHEQIENNLNTELQRYKNDFYDKLASPFLMQFIGLYMDITEECEELEEELEKAPDNDFLKMHLKSLRYYADSVRGALTNNGVEIKTPEPGSKYDYKEQRISKTVPADDPELRDCIASVRSSAFIYNGKILRPAKVVVYKV